MRMESGHKSPFGYHTLEFQCMPSGKKDKVLVWHENSEVNDTKERV